MSFSFLWRATAAIDIWTSQFREKEKNEANSEKEQQKQSKVELSRMKICRAEEIKRCVCVRKVTTAKVKIKVVVKQESQIDRQISTDRCSLALVLSIIYERQEKRVN